MSDDEEVMSSEEEEMPQKSGPSEAEIAMKKRQAAAAYGNLAEDAQELLASNKVERDHMADEIAELRRRSEQRKKEREEEERRLAQKRQEEERQRKAEEEARRAKKDEEEAARRAKRAEKMAEFEKWKNPQKPNFVISKRAAGDEGADEGADDETKEKVSREQLEAEKRAILAQRIPKLEIDGFDAQKLTAKAGELHTLLHRLYSETYDLERRFKIQQYDMMELAERARQMNQVGRGGLKRISMKQDEDVDKMQQKFAGCPSKVVMIGKFDRQVDPRPYGSKRTVFSGATYAGPAARIAPQRIVKWAENGLPMYEDIEGVVRDEGGEEGGEEGEEE